jgi:hypothetical protein
MAEVVDLDALIPDDIEFKHRGKSYMIPGDIPTQEVFKLYKLYLQLAEAETSEDADADAQEAATDRVKEGLLSLFQVLQPDMKQLPFGAMSLTIVLQTILLKLGVVQQAQEASPTGLTQPNRAARRASTKKPGSTGRTQKKRTATSST